MAHLHAKARADGVTVPIPLRRHLVPRHMVRRGRLSSVSLSYQTGQAGMLLAWLDGQFIGSHQMATPATAQATTQGWAATATMPVPAAAGGGGKHVLAVLVRSMSHQEDGGANNAFKPALGLTAVTFAGASPSVTWRIQGNRGGERIVDPVRGPLNSGGLPGGGLTTGPHVSGGLGAVSLTSLGTAAGGVPVAMVRSPGYRDV